MGQIGFREILVILLIVIILFGAKRIPELMRGMGQGIKEFKGGMKDPDALPPSTLPPSALPPSAQPPSAQPPTEPFPPDDKK